MLRGLLVLALPMAAVWLSAGTGGPYWGANAALAVEANAAEIGQDAKRPHVLFLAGDDLGPRLGCYGHSQMVTPRMDSLAASATRSDAVPLNPHFTEHGHLRADPAVGCGRDLWSRARQHGNRSGRGTRAGATDFGLDCFTVGMSFRGVRSWLRAGCAEPWLGPYPSCHNHALRGPFPSRDCLR
ncbi:MAG: hypothetical protein ACQESR_26365 [Planctomycetota bacterium]